MGATLEGGHRAGEVGGTCAFPLKAAPFPAKRLCYKGVNRLHSSSSRDPAVVGLEAPPRAIAGLYRENLREPPRSPVCFRWQGMPAPEERGGSQSRHSTH